VAVLVHGSWYLKKERETKNRKHAPCDNQTRHKREKKERKKKEACEKKTHDKKS
jgi:FtsZ-interacting cell division protein ZipA